ncbi:MAG TPA: hypothetical protein VMT75_06625 [Candidatus Saccharimonadales bacterium]|nr:hypothetical protein [Candidatus Saccharimonadales bacterium]
MPEVKIPTASAEVPAWLENPRTTPPWPGVVVLHDAAGMSRDLKNHAGWLATTATWPWRPICSRRVKIFKRPGRNIEAGRQGVLDSGRVGEP